MIMLGRMARVVLDIAEQSAWAVSVSSENFQTLVLLLGASTTVILQRVHLAM